MIIWLPHIAIGIVSVLFLLMITVTLRSFYQKVYLVSRDSLVEGEAVIPLTPDLKKRSLFHLLNGRWKENIDLTLMDYRESSYSYQISYHLFLGYRIQSNEKKAVGWLAGKPVIPGRKYRLKNKMVLKVGDRPFEIMITANRPPEYSYN